MFTLMRILIRKKKAHTYKLQLELVQRRFFTFNGPSLLSLSFLFFSSSSLMSIMPTNSFFSRTMSLLLYQDAAFNTAEKKAGKKN